MTLHVGEIWREVKTGRRLRVVITHVHDGRDRVAVRNCETGRLSYMQRWRFNAELVKEPTRADAQAAIARRLDAPLAPIRMTGSCFILADVSIKCWLCGTMTTPSVAHRCEVK